VLDGCEPCLKSYGRIIIEVSLILNNMIQSSVIPLNLMTNKNFGHYNHLASLTVPMKKGTRGDHYVKKMRPAAISRPIVGISNHRPVVLGDKDIPSDF
jgi:hypothetical protein